MRLLDNSLYHYSENSGAGNNGNVDEFAWPNELIDLKGHDMHGRAITVSSAYNI